MRKNRITKRMAREIFKNGYVTTRNYQYYEEEDGLVVLDYKTDRVRESRELVERYHGQLDYYARALEQATGKTVKEKIIYSFTLGEEIHLP